MSPSTAIVLFVAAILIWGVLDTIREYREWKAERDRRFDECFASLIAPEPEDPAREAQYRHLRRVL